VSDELRAFFAIELPTEARASVLEAVERLKSVARRGVRWMSVDTLHLTLKFLGEIREDDVPRLIARAQAKLAPEEPFDVGLAGYGAFPNAREARALWVGVSEGASALARLARKLDSASRAIGAPRERRPFEPHLTLGRLRDPLHVELDRATPPDSVAWTVSEVVLYESRLSKEGARHVPLARFPLGAGGDAEHADFAPEP
jgi:2'-5' RNA ligase